MNYLGHGLGVIRSIAMSVKSYRVLEGLFYTPNHEWIKKEDDILVVGITDYAQNALGDIVFLEVKEASHQIQKGDSVGVIESVKAAEDIHAPIDGIIASVNSKLMDEPEKINIDSYLSWILKIKSFDRSGLDDLMDMESYKHLVASLGV